MQPNSNQPKIITVHPNPTWYYLLNPLLSSKPDQLGIVPIWYYANQPDTIHPNPLGMFISVLTVSSPPNPISTSFNPTKYYLNPNHPNHPFIKPFTVSLFAFCSLAFPKARIYLYLHSFTIEPNLDEKFTGGADQDLKIMESDNFGQGGKSQSLIVLSPCHFYYYHYFQYVVYACLFTYEIIV